MGEKWVEISGHPGYEISDAGRVRTKSRDVRIGNGATRRQEGKILSQWLQSGPGYPQVQLSGKRRVAVHRLVAGAFLQGYASGMVVNHKNGVKTDNRAENLEWVSQAENNRHAHEVLGVPGSCKGKFSEKHPTSKAVVATCLKTGATRFYAAGMDAVREGYRSDSISRCCAGKIKSHKGFVWRFAGPPCDTIRSQTLDREGVSA